MRKQKNIKKKLVILLLIILAIICILFGSTYSKYATQVYGKGIIQVAKWAFLVNGQTATMTNINLAKTYNAKTLVENRIAPGTNGSFDIIIDATGSEVGIEYSVKFENETDKPQNIEYTYEGTTVQNIKELESLLKGIIDANSEEKSKTLTIFWKWKYETGNNTQEIVANDKKDTNDGKMLDTYRFDVIVTGMQLEPKE